MEVEGGRAGRGGGGGGGEGGGGREGGRMSFTAAGARRSIGKETDSTTVWWNPATEELQMRFLSLFPLRSVSDKTFTI